MYDEPRVGFNHGLTLVTRNSRDVESTGVPLVDPWQIR